MLPKIDELGDIAKRTKAAMIGILESKLDSNVLDPEIYIEIMKFFVSIEISMEEVLLVTLEVTLAIN